MTDKKKGQSFKPKRYRGKKMRTKIQGLELKSETDFLGWCSDVEGYIFNIGPRASEKFSKTTKKLEQYAGVDYRGSCQLSIMTNIPATLTNPEMPKITPTTSVVCPKIDT